MKFWRKVYVKITQSLITLIGLLLLTFVLLQLSPGDPVLDSMSGTRLLGTESENFEDLYDQHRRSLNLHLPLFYLSVHDGSGDKRIREIPLTEERKNVERWTLQTGAPDLAVELYSVLKDCAVSAPQNAGVKCSICLTLSKYDDALVAAKKIDYPPIQASLSEKEIIQEKKSSLLPKLNWNGKVNQFHHWVAGTSESPGLLLGNWGHSRMYKRDINSILFPALWRTLSIALPALILGWLAGVLLGALAARDEKKFRWIHIFLAAAYIAPTFWVAVMLLHLFSNPDILAVFPPAFSLSGPQEESTLLQHFTLNFSRSFLPLLCWMLVIMGVAGLQMKNSLEVLKNQPFLTTALAKGLSPNQVHWKHAVKNGLFPSLSAFNQLIPIVLTGSLAIEIVFSINGIGKLAYEAMLAKDHQLVYSLILITGIITLFGSFFTDLLYHLADPRVKINHNYSV